MELNRELIICPTCKNNSFHSWEILWNKEQTVSSIPCKVCGELFFVQRSKIYVYTSYSKEESEHLNDN